MKVFSESAFPKLSVASSVKEAQIAIAATEKLSQIKIFRWSAYAVAINATSQNGSWDIEWWRTGWLGWRFEGIWVAH